MGTILNDICWRFHRLFSPRKFPICSTMEAVKKFILYTSGGTCHFGHWSIFTLSVSKFSLLQWIDQ